MVWSPRLEDEICFSMPTRIHTRRANTTEKLIDFDAAEDIEYCMRSAKTKVYSPFKFEIIEIYLHQYKY